MNPTPSLEAQVFKRASDKVPFNPILETCILDTGCTSSCIPLSVAKAHRIKVKPLDEDEPSMHSFNGSKLKVVGKARLYIKIKTPNGFTPKKLLHCQNQKRPLKMRILQSLKVLLK